MAIRPLFFQDVNPRKESEVMKDKKCPLCKAGVDRFICFGLPMWLCSGCYAGGGIGSWFFRWSKGNLLKYEGSYWMALWWWLLERRQS